MENQKKVVYAALVGITLFALLWGYNTYNVSSAVPKNPNLVREMINGGICINLEKTLHNQTPRTNLCIDKVYDNQEKPTSVSSVINLSQLDFIINFEEDKIKINNGNQELRDGDTYAYLKDDKYVYIYPEYIYQSRQENYSFSQRFFIAGSIKNYELLGGPYLRIGGKVYWRGYEVIGADSSTFTTEASPLKDHPAEFTIGKDKNGYFNGDKKMTKEIAEEYLFTRKLTPKE
ncbi:DKNYY domain-containing protein [uncultured Thiothrix sp.]|uniref:DKNYY domain-containing protein n=1 Tax=uncultured Thiothrix sp. TaxID=223185 RepID=UPI00262D28E9|nr:DKNYY domain-containing protein [uncultured Thiothrix sp.]